VATLLFAFKQKTNDGVDGGVIKKLKTEKGKVKKAEHLWWY